MGDQQIADSTSSKYHENQQQRSHLTLEINRFLDKMRDSGNNNVDDNQHQLQDYDAERNQPLQKQQRINTIDVTYEDADTLIQKNSQSNYEPTDNH